MNEIIYSVRQWVETFVVEYNLCPFAKRELVNQRIHFHATDAVTEEQLLTVLQEQLIFLNKHDSIETTLLIHPCVLQDFDHYNQFLSLAEGLLVEMNVEGVYQIASFHPDYQFAETDINDAENYTNRSPYPMLHLLREASLERAIESYSDVEQIPLNNIERMNRLGKDRLATLLNSYRSIEANNDKM